MPALSLSLLLAGAASGASAAAASAGGEGSGENAEGDDDDEVELVEEVEEVIEALLGALRDKDTVVRWSGAKVCTPGACKRGGWAGGWADNAPTGDSNEPRAGWQVSIVCRPAPCCAASQLMGASVCAALRCGMVWCGAYLWCAAAQGIGRITGCLPRELGDEVVASVLELFRPTGEGAATRPGQLR